LFVLIALVLLVFAFLLALLIPLLMLFFPLLALLLVPLAVLVPAEMEAVVVANVAVVVVVIVIVVLDRRTRAADDDGSAAVADIVPEVRLRLLDVLLRGDAGVDERDHADALDAAD